MTLNIIYKNLNIYYTLLIKNSCGVISEIYEEQQIQDLLFFKLLRNTLETVHFLLISVLNSCFSVCFCLCCRDPTWFTESWLGRIKSDVADNWRLKVLSNALITISCLSSLTSVFIFLLNSPVCFNPATLSLTLISCLAQGCYSWLSPHPDPVLWPSGYVLMNVCQISSSFFAFKLSSQHFLTFCVFSDEQPEEDPADGGWLL